MSSHIKLPGWTLALVAPLCLVAIVLVMGDDPPAATDDAAAADPYAIAEGATQAQLQQQFQQLLQMAPPTNTPEGLKEHLVGVRRFVQALQDPARQIDDDLLNGAFDVEYQVLQVLTQLQDPDAPAEAEAFKARLEEDEREVAQNLLALIRVSERIQLIGTMAADERAAFIEEIAMGLSGEMDETDFEFASQVGAQIEFVAPDEAAGVYELFVKYLSENSDANSVQMAQFFQGKANYLGLPGNEMAFTSTTVDGESFDIATVAGQGNVVLVDFWATWCGPCVAELPNLKAHYAAYHEQGFEIVGVSLDDDPDALKQFIVDHELTWPMLFDFDPATQTSPLANKYGIQAIPSCILINQEGKVVSLDARGEELNRLLVELLGPPPAPASE